MEEEGPYIIRYKKSVTVLVKLLNIEDPKTILKVIVDQKSIEYVF